MFTLFKIPKSDVHRARCKIHSDITYEWRICDRESWICICHLRRIIQEHTHFHGEIVILQAILVLDGTYIYTNLQFQRQLFCVQKGRPLVHPMIIVSTRTKPILREKDAESIVLDSNVHTKTLECLTF